jgi:hypothetical protein
MLQGSLDNFALHEVLGLLSDTAKTGRMRVTGDRGSGSLWLDAGQLIGSEASRAAADGPIEETMFELLRFTTGNFSFNADETPASKSDPRPVPDVLAEAKARLEQWREIEAVVPSLAHIIAPVAVLPAPEVTITADEWELLMAIGGGTEVGTICELFELGEVEGSRRVKLLIERELVEISTPAPMTRRETGTNETDRFLGTSDDFGVAPAGLTTEMPDDTIDADDGPDRDLEFEIADAHLEPGAFSATGDDGGISFDHSMFDVPESESGRFDAATADDAASPDAMTPSDSGFFEVDTTDHELGGANPAGVDAPAITPPMPPRFGADGFGTEGAGSALRRRLTDSTPPPPPAPPAGAMSDLYDAPAPPPPAPPSPADLAGTDRLEAGEARRLLGSRDDAFSFPSTPDAAAGDEADDDGSLLMQYLRDES